MKRTLEEFISESNIIHNYKYDYSLVDYVNTNTKVKIICKKHGIFDQIPKSHLKGSGCPKCKGGVKLDNKSFIEKSKLVHGNKYDYSLVNYINAKSKIKIICKEHGIFEQSANSHLQNHGCPYCYGNVKINNFDFINKCKDLHDDKYDYSLVKYKGNKSKVKIICKEHGIFEQMPTKHYYQGCPKCANKKRSDKIKLSKSDFLKRSNKIHKYKYDYSILEYISSIKKIKIICPIHGIFEQQPSAHMNGSGCPKCANEEKGKYKLLNNEIFINKSNEVHKNKYNYSLVNYVRSHKKVKILCSKHGIFEQLPYVHLNGSGCPYCQNSKGEEKIQNYLKKNNIEYCPQHTFKKCKYKSPLFFDFYLPKYNICVEYDGEQHFKKRHKGDTDENLKIRQTRDQIKNIYCKNNNIKLLRIHYTELKNIDFILEEKLKNN